MRRGARASDQQTQLLHLLRRSVDAWGRDVRHLWDREFASGPWLCVMLEHNIRFVLRWKKRNKLLDSWGEARKAWEITRRKRSWGYRHLRASHTGERHKVGVVAVCVTHPAHPQPLWLVVARPGQQYEPWNLLTSAPIRTAEDAWGVVLAYGRRWQIECAWRYSKSELAGVDKRLGGANADPHCTAEVLLYSRTTARDPAARHRIPVRFLHPLNGYEAA
jgi:Transposase DDE domain